MHTQQEYIRHVRRFAAFLGHPLGLAIGPREKWSGLDNGKTVQDRLLSQTRKTRDPTSVNAGCTWRSFGQPALVERDRIIKECDRGIGQNLLIPVS